MMMKLGKVAKMERKTAVKKKTTAKLVDVQGIDKIKTEGKNKIRRIRWNDRRSFGGIGWGQKQKTQRPKILIFQDFFLSLDEIFSSPYLINNRRREIGFLLTAATAG